MSAASQTEYDPSKDGLARLTIHIAEKGMQTGSVLGTTAMPVTAAYKSFVKKQPVHLLGLTRVAGLSHVGVVGLVAALGTAKVSGLDADGIEDRAYRLYYNQGQNRTDAFARVGAGVGLAAALVGLRGLPGVGLMNYLGLLSVGTTGGVLLHVLTSRAAK